MKTPDLVGVRFGRLLVLAHAGIVRLKQGTQSQWLCHCDCGRDVVKYHRLLLECKSCGCGIYQGKVTHGRSATPTYKAWQSMRRRCYTATAIEYKYYGARGISVCDRWRSGFAEFLADMGERPTSRHSLDRIDVNGNYEPGNCRWATRSEQMRNTRATKLTADLANEIVGRVEHGESRASVSKRMGLNVDYVKSVCSGRYWADAVAPISWPATRTA